jgi:hypothetical protein
MGVTIENKNKAIDLGYGGFNLLRTKIAYLTNEELGKFYDELLKGTLLFGEEREKFFDEYNKRLNQIDEELNVSPYILDFLYAPDCNAKMSVKHCRRIYKVIKDYDDDVLYGYSGRPDCAMFKDFKAIVKDCIDHNIQMYWW